MASEEFYPSEEATEAPTEEATETPEQVEEQAEKGETALLPKSIFPEGVKAGGTYTIKVDALYEEEAAVSLVAGEEKEQAPMDQAMGEMDAMAGE